MPSRRILPLATQLSATPPARHSRRCPVSARTERASRSTTSSVTAWIEAAMSMWNWVSSSEAGSRTGWPNRRENAPLVMVRPVQ
jgi:hypothetical protein